MVNAPSNGQEMSTASGSRFFIAGSQRSGTTLVRLVLGSHPDVLCLDEHEGYAALATGSYDSERRLAGFKVPKWTEMLGEEAPADPEAAGVYQGEPIVFLLRDVRDTVASMCRLRSSATASWLEAWGRPILEEAIARRPGFADRFAREIARLRDRNSPEVAVGALYWKFKTISYFDHVERGRPVCPIPYERLTINPEPVLRRVLKFLGLRWDPAVLDHSHREHRGVFESGLTVGNTDPKRAIDSRSVGLWRETFSEDQERIILDVAGDLNERIAAVA